MKDLTLEEIQAIKDRCKDSNHGEWEGGLTMYNCPVCQKRVVIHNESSWVYKRKRFLNKNKYVLLYFCSYGCTRKFDSIYEKPKKPIVFE